MSGISVCLYSLMCCSDNVHLWLPKLSLSTHRLEEDLDNEKWLCTQLPAIIQKNGNLWLSIQVHLRPVPFLAWFCT